MGYFSDDGDARCFLYRLYSYLQRLAAKMGYTPSSCIFSDRQEDRDDV